MSLKCKSRNLKPGKREKKTSGPNGQLSRSTKISKTKETQWGESCGSIPSRVAGNVFVGNSHL